MANRIQLRRGGAQEWANSNPTLAQGELGVELDTGRIKIGDGVTAWNTLRYERPVESISNTANTLVQRDADGNFAAGTITATLIGSSSTAARLSSTRQIQLSNDLSASGVFDGSQNLNLSAELSLISTLPHYDGTATPTGTYTKVVVDSKGRIINASNPTTLADYGLNGTVEGSSAQPYDLDLVAIAGLTTTGLISRTSGGAMATRTITGTSGRIQVNNGGGIAANPAIDLITTTVTSGDYNTESLTSVSGSQTVNATKFSVDDYGRLTSATTVPIATAVEGTTALDYNAATSYSRYDIIKNASKVYQAYQDISAGQGAPTHSSGDNGGWRYLAAESTEQKGLASFAQEDFDVTSGHVSIATAGVDNPQLQNSRISFADGNSVEHFDLDQELTATTGYRGLTGVNYLNVKNTSGGLLFAANNTGDSGNGEVDINVKTLISDPDIVLDGSTAQAINKSGDGDLQILLTQNTTSPRTLSIAAQNGGSGASQVTVSAENVVDIQATDAAGKVHIETMRFQADHIGATGDILIDPNDDRDVSGKVTIRGNLQVDGTTTTVNSTITTLDDPIITLGGDTAPASDDNKDRGVEFRYYDTQARLGFFGWDTNYTDLAGHGGGYNFLHAATNSSEVFSGTASGLTAGNLKLTSNTNSTSNSTGDLVLLGGAGIAQDVNIGGLLDVDGTFRANSTSRFDDTMVLQAASKSMQIKNGSGTTKIELHTTSGNVDVGGIITSTGAIDANSTLNVASTVRFEDTDEPTVAQNSGTGLYDIQSNDYGSFRFDGGGYIEGDTVFNSDIYINGDLNQKDSATENFGQRNYLNVRYKLRAGSTVQYTPSYATDNTANFRVFGGAGIGTSLHIGGTSSGQGLFVGKKNSGNTVKFSVLGASGNTDIQGTLDVAGASEFNGTVDVDADFAVRNGTTDKFFVDNVTGNTVIEGSLNVNGVTDIDADFAVRNGTTDKFFVDNVTGNTNIEGTLTADGHTELNSTLNVDSNTTLGGTLTVTNNSEFNGTVDVDNNFAVRSGTTDKFTVASSTGNVATDGTLVVQGQTTINDSLIVDASNENFKIQNGSSVDKFTVDSDNGNTNIIGTLTVGSATQINNTLGVSNVTTITRNTQQTLTGSYSADGAFRLTGGAGIGKNLAIGEGLRVYGGTELTGALDLNNSADISGALVTHDNVTITADNKTFKIQNGSGADKFVVDTDNGNTELQGTLTVVGDITTQGDYVVSGNLTVNGTTTTVNSTVMTVDDPVITVGGDTAPASNDGKDKGIEFRYYDTQARLGFFGYDKSANQFAFITGATNTSEVFSGTDGALRAGSLNLTGSGTGLDVDGNANIDGTLTVDGQITSQVSSGPALVIPTTDKINNLNADLLDSMTTASANTASTVVNRDSNGDFAANQITAASAAGAGAGFLGNASTADAWKTARTFTIDGVVSGSVSVDGSSAPTITTTFVDSDITALAAQGGTGYVVRTGTGTYAQRTLQVTASSGITLTNADGVSGNTTINVASASSSAANNLVLRDSSGDFAANEITADLVGNLTATNSTAKNLNPVADSTYSLGTSTLQWSNIHADEANIDTVVGDLTGDVIGNLTATNSTAKNLNPAADSTYSLGSTLIRWSNGYFDDINASGTITGDLTGDVSGNLVATTSTAKNLNPATDSLYSLGSTLIRWANIYADDINATGTITGDVNGDLSGNLTATNSTAKNLSPVADSTYNLGTTIVRWANIYADDISASGTITGDLSGDVTGNLLATQTNSKSIVPSLDSSYNLGNSILRWANIYADDITVTNTVNGDVNGNLTGNLLATQTDSKSIVPADDSTYNLGNSIKRWANIYADDISAGGTITGNVNGDVTGDLLATTTNAKSIIPIDDSSYNLGSSIKRWANIYADDITAGGTITGDVNGDLTGDLLATTTNAKSIVPESDSTRSLGSSIKRWANIYVDDITVTNAISATVNGTATQAANLNNHDTDALSEGSTNQYYTEARVQTKLDHAFEQLSAMLNNLATSTTLTLNLSGDPTPGAVVATSVSNGGGGGFSGATAVSTSGGTGSGLTVDTTVDGNGNITAAAVNAGGSDYLISDTVTITNANAGKALTLNLASIVGGTGYVTGTGIAVTGGNGSGMTADITANAGALTNIVINSGGTGFTAGDTVTITNANATVIKTLGSIATAGTGYSALTGVATSSSGSGTGATVDLTVGANGAVTAVALNAAGSGYAADEVLTITNANATGVNTLGSFSDAGTGYANGTAIATTSSGSGTGLTLDITTSNGVITGATINNDGSGYAASEVITIVNANASGIKTVGNFGATDAARTPGTYTLGTSDYSTQASGANATFTVVIGTGGTVDSVTVTDDGSGFIVNETVTVLDAQLGGGGAAALTFDVTAIHGNGAQLPVSAIHGNSATIPVSAIHGNGATVDIATVATNATLALSDITTMEVGATVTGATSGTTGTITALGTNQITVDNVDGFFKKGETVSANDVSALTINSFS